MKHFAKEWLLPIGIFLGGCFIVLLIGVYTTDHSPSQSDAWKDFEHLRPDEPEYTEQQIKDAQELIRQRDEIKQGGL